MSNNKDFTVKNSIVVGGTVDGRDLATDGTKLDGIETGATADQTITAGAGLTGGGTGDVSLSHANTSSQASVNNSGTTFIQDITLDTYGHITALSSATVSVPEAFPSGTKMLFQQTAAPTGWTKDVVHNDKALRVVSGIAGSGGTGAFSTIFDSNRTSSGTTAGGSISNTTAGGTVGSTTLTSSQMPSHRHRVWGLAGGPIAIVGSQTRSFMGGQSGNWTDGFGGEHVENTGGGSSHNHSFTGSSHGHTFTGSSHTHTLDMRVQYVDLIIATKD